MVPRQNWTKLRELTLPLSDFLLVLCKWILPDCFQETINLLENHSQGPCHQTTIFSAILHFYGMDFEKTSSKFGSTTLSDGFCAKRGA